MSDASLPERAQPPRPQYGEYATPEEQRARIRQPEASAAIEAGLAPGSAPAQVPAPVAPVASPASAAPRSSVDRVVTTVLLALGAMNVFLTVPGLFVLDEQFDRVFEILGVDAHLGDVAGARAWGSVAAISLIIGWVVTAVLSWRRLRRGRVAFWMPLVGAVATMLVVFVCMNAALFGDPAFPEILEQLNTTPL